MHTLHSNSATEAANTVGDPLDSASARTVATSACPTCGAISKVCRVCGRRFAANAARSGHTYCSLACKTAATTARRRARRPDRTCAVCRRMFDRPLTRGRPPARCPTCRTNLKGPPT